MNLPIELQTNESVILVVRRHPVYMVAKLVAAGLAALVPVALVLWLVSLTVGFSGVFGWIVIGAAVVWVLICGAYGFFTWYRHQHDLWIVTNQRLLDVSKRNLFDQRVSSADLVNVQDISIEKGGILATLFNFGDVRCQTAGAQSGFVLSGVPNPAFVLSKLDAARDAARLPQSVADRTTAPGDVVPGLPSQSRPHAGDRIPGSS
jgi:membrane protein YdbS with pleckstrin-like domain